MKTLFCALRCTAAPAPLLLISLALGVLLISTSQPVYAGDWRTVWSDGFEDGNLNGWTQERFSREDTIRLVPDPNAVPTEKCEPTTMLYASSPGERSGIGSGYRVSSPKLSDMGVDYLRPYKITFDYMLPENREACWTYALASRAATLVVQAATPVANGVGKATLGWVDSQHANFKPLGVLTLGETYRFEILATPHPDRGTCEFRVSLNGAVLGGGEREDCSTYERIELLDLPFLPLSVEGELPEIRACFGAGYWDNFSVTVDKSRRPPGGRGIDIGIYPSPFNPRTEVQFELGEAGPVQVSVYDVAGRMVRMLCDEFRSAGTQRIPWEGKDDRGVSVASGSYIILVRAGGEQVVARAVLVR